MQKLRHLIFQIKSFFYWGWKLKDSVPWDAHSIYEILYLKLDQLYQYAKKDEIYQWTDEDQRLMRNLAEARELTKRIVEDSYSNLAYAEIYGSSEPDIINFIQRLNVMDEEERKFRMRVYKKYGDLERSHKKRLFYLLEKNISHWWN